MTPGSILEVGNQRLIKRGNNIMELELKGSNKLLLMIRKRIVIHVVNINHKSLLLLKHIVYLKTFHKNRIQVIIDNFCPPFHLLQSFGTVAFKFI
jgi:hypothetical protein